MEKIEKGVGILDKALSLVEKYKIRTIFKGIFIILLIAGVFGFISNPTYVFELYDDYREKIHAENMNLMIKNNQLIQADLELLMQKTGADRCLLLSYHNTKESLAGMPYIYLTATHEVLNFNVKPVADGYEQVKTSLYPFLTYINKNQYFCGDISELKAVDKALAYRMEGNDVQHLAIINIETEIPLGVIVLTYTHNVDENHVCMNIEKEVRRTATKIGILLGGH